MPTKVELRKTLAAQGIKATNADIAEAAKALGFDDKMAYSDEEGRAIAQRLTTGQPQAQQPQPQVQKAVQPNNLQPKEHTQALAKATQARTAAVSAQIEALEQRDEALVQDVGRRLAHIVKSRPARIEQAFLQEMEGYEFNWDEFLGVQHLEDAIAHFRLPSSSTVACLPSAPEG
jgi:hypothetical protein